MRDGFILMVVFDPVVLLQVLESVVKNCGSTIHVEVATKEFMEFMKDHTKVKQVHQLKPWFCFPLSPAWFCQQCGPWFFCM